MHYHKYRLIIPFLAPSILLYAVFVLWPYTQAIYVSLTQWRGVSANRKFVGLDNFRKLADDANFWNALRHNGEMLVALPVVTLSIALAFAALFTQGRHSVAGAGFYRIVFFFPQVISAVIVGVLWSFAYHPTLGLVNGFLESVGLSSLKRTWLGDPSYALWAIAAIVVWQAVGFYMVLFIAGMQSIPADFYEAATLDGANRWQTFWGITLPLIWDNVRVAIVYIGIAALDLFAIVQVMTAGGPNRSSDVLAHYMYEVAFTDGQFGYATAIGVTLLVLTLILSVITLRLTKREGYEF